jgi:hypothetical protein
VLRGGRLLGDQALSAANQVGLALEGTRTVLTGGVLQHPSPLLSDTIMSRLPGGLAVRPTVPPAIGALLLAYDDAGIAAHGTELASRYQRTA